MDGTAAIRSVSEGPKISTYTGTVPPTFYELIVDVIYLHHVSLFKSMLVCNQPTPSCEEPTPSFFH